MSKKSSAEQVGAPLLVLGATWIAKQLAETTYRMLAGEAPPSPRDPDAKLRNVILWSAGLAAALAAAEVIVARISDDQ